MSLFSKISELVKKQLSPGETGAEKWPFIRGSYYVADATAAVAVITLGNEKLAKDLATLATKGLCMACPLSGGRADIEKLVHTLTGNMSIQHLLCVGEEIQNSGTLAAIGSLLSDDEDLDVALNAAGRSKMRLTGANVAALRKQIQFTDMHGCVEIDKIVSRIQDLSTNAKRRTTGFVAPNGKTVDAENRVIAADTLTHELVEDKAGYFKISINQPGIVVEHFNNKQERLRTIEGTSARSICLTIIRNGWISRLDHAAYLGRELARAELALQSGGDFSQEAGVVE